MPRAKTLPDIPTDRLDEMLVRLKLSGIRDQLDSVNPRFLCARSRGSCECGVGSCVNRDRWTR
jgi:hypothetical protein